jgi:hypothetical protein
MQDFHLLEKLAHQNHERIPERTVHAKGSGAYGTLTVTAQVAERLGERHEAIFHARAGVNARGWRRGRDDGSPADNTAAGMSRRSGICLF